MKNIIFDTDIGGDCDDAAALALALELMNAGECRLLAVTHCTSQENAAGCIKAILDYYGHPEIPVGIFPAGRGLASDVWKDVYATDTMLRHRSSAKPEGCGENTVALLRRILAESPERVTIVVTGPLTSLAELLTGGPDGYSPLSGVELVQQKVDAAICMAGRFFEAWPEPIILKEQYVVEAEWNVKGDITAAQTVCDLWPAKLIFCSYEIGLNMITCGRLQTEGPVGNPVRTCYELWSGRDGGNSVGRESCDPATMLYAIRPGAGYWDLHPYGRLRVDDMGRTFWQEDAVGRHTFLLEGMPHEEVADIIDEILERDISRSA